MKKITKSIISMILVFCIFFLGNSTAMLVYADNSEDVPGNESAETPDIPAEIDESEEDIPEDDETVYHTVTFLDADGNPMGEQKVADGYAPVAPDDPVKTPDPESGIGYYFVGWEPSITSPVYEDTTYTPVFKEITEYKITINYLKDDGTTLFPSVVATYASDEDFEDTYESPKSDVWTPDTTSVVVTPETFAAESDITVNVTYTRTGVYYTVIHCFEDLNGEYEADRTTETLTAQIGEQVFPEALETIPEGFEYSSSSEPVEIISKDEEYVLYVYYNRVINTVIFEVNGGEAIVAKSGKYGSQIEMPSTTRISYTLEGWYTNPEFTGDPVNAGDTVSIPSARITTYYAKWKGEEVTYSVVYLVEKPNLGYQPTESNVNPDDFVKTNVEYDDRKAIAGSEVTASDADKNYVFTAGNLYGDTNSYAKDVKIASYLCADTKTVAADGSTVVYVYFTLDHFTYVFDVYNSFKRYGDDGDHLDPADAVHLYFKYYNVPAGISGTNENGYYSEIVMRDVHYGENVSDRWPDVLVGQFYVKENGKFITLAEADMKISLGITQGSFSFDGWRGIMSEPINTLGHNGIKITGRILCNYNRSGEGLSNKWRGCLMVSQSYARHLTIVEKLVIPADAPRNTTGAEIEFTLEDIAKYTNRYGKIERENQSDLFCNWKVAARNNNDPWKSYVLSKEGDFDPNEDYWLNLNGTATTIFPNAYNWYVSKISGFDYDEVKTRDIYQVKVLSSADKYYDAYRTLCPCVKNSCSFPWIWGDGKGLETDDTVAGTRTGNTILTYGSGTRLMPFIYKRLDFTLNFVPMLGDELFAEAEALNVSYEVPYEAPLSYYEPFTEDVPKTFVDINGVKYTFTGWYYDAEYTQPVDWTKDTMPAQGISVFGKWVPETIKITFDHNYPGAPKPVTYVIVPGDHMEDQEGFVAAPERENYTFIAWYEDPQSAEDEFEVDQGVAKVYNGQTLYAHWAEVKVPYTVRYLDRRTGDILIEAKIVSDNRIGKEVTESYVAIPGYAVDELEKSITLSKDESENVIIFWYETGVELEYKVIHHYVDPDGNDVYINEFTSEDGYTTTTDIRVVEYAGHEDIPSDYAPTKQQKSLELTLNKENNVIIFEYMPLPEAKYIVHHYYQEDVAQTLSEYPEKLTVDSGMIAKGYSYTAKREIKEGYKIVRITVEEDKRAINRDLYLTVSDAEIKAGVVHVHMYYSIINETDITVRKEWNDDGDRDGIRPEEITIYLYANGEKYASAVLSAATNWEYTFENLPIYASPKTPIEYEVKEVSVGGYETEINGFVITNTHAPETIDLSGKKTWVDEDEATRPESITINLFANGDFVTSKTVTAEDGWEWTFEDLYKYDDGEEIEYTVTEDAVKDYDASYDGLNVTNTYNPDIPNKISVSGRKIWDDNGNQDGMRPARITINLLADGVKVDSVTVTARDNWSYTFEDLDETKNGKKIEYTITEDKVPGYTTKIDGYNVTNTYVPEKINISGEKTWNDDNNKDGIRPEEITIYLYANGERVAVKRVTEEDNWAWTFYNFDKYENGRLIVYSITEAKVENYTTVVNGFDVTNTYEPEKTEVSGMKTWNDDDNRDGVRPESITINLYADGVKIDSMIVTEADGWRWSFTDLDRYSDGEEIVYTIKEEAIEYYTSVVSGYNVINTYNPEKTNVSGVKTWNDADDKYGMRPDSITINLLANGEIVESVIVTEADGWSWSFTDLDKYMDGELIVYTITEDEVEGYVTTVNGYDVTNTYPTEEEEPAVVVVPVTKIWDDEDDADGVRPEAITVNLYANGELVETVVITAADGWKAVFENLPKYDENGSEIVYTVTENEVPEYTVEITGDAAEGFVIVNTYVTELEEEEVPLAPQTGDGAITFILVMLVSSVIISSIAVVDKRRRVR